MLLLCKRVTLARQIVLSVRDKGAINTYPLQSIFLELCFEKKVENPSYRILYLLTSFRCLIFV